MDNVDPAGSDFSNRGCRAMLVYLLLLLLLLFSLLLFPGCEKHMEANNIPAYTQEEQYFISSLGKVDSFIFVPPNEILALTSAPPGAGFFYVLDVYDDSVTLRLAPTAAGQRTGEGTAIKTWSERFSNKPSPGDNDFLFRQVMLQDGIMTDDTVQRNGTTVGEASFIPITGVLGTPVRGAIKINVQSATASLGMKRVLAYAPFGPLPGAFNLVTLDFPEYTGNFPKNTLGSSVFSGGLIVVSIDVQTIKEPFWLIPPFNFNRAVNKISLMSDMPTSAGNIVAGNFLAPPASKGLNPLLMWKHYRWSK